MMTEIVLLVMTSLTLLLLTYKAYKIVKDEE